MYSVNNRIKTIRSQGDIYRGYTKTIDNKFKKQRESLTRIQRHTKRVDVYKEKADKDQLKLTIEQTEESISEIFKIIDTMEILNSMAGKLLDDFLEDKAEYIPFELDEPC